ncbi:MAG: hypothetical protein MJ180_02645 [Candidatus Gastranaerophilales bacterium]|nr:hypothetical protein [Candidatus Gastranaerophilales bacterium]
MSFSITTKKGETTFTDKEVVNICSHAGFDLKLDVDFKCMLSIQYDKTANKCTVLNQFNNPKFLFKGKTLPAKLDVEKICKIMIDGTDEFITIKVLGESNITNVEEENLTETDMKELYGEDVNASARLKIEKRKVQLEQARIAITKEILFLINDLKHKISMNSKAGIVLHIALILASLLCAFGVSNYLMGLPLKDAANVIQMPTNLKLIFVYTFLIFGIGAILKQGVFVYLQNKIGEDTTTSKIAEKFMIAVPSIFYIGIYFINVLYYMTSKALPVFSVLISLFFVGMAGMIAMACGYYKHNSVCLRQELDKYEYREDFEKVLKEYQSWIERFVNNLSDTKIRNIKDKTFMLQLKAAGEILLGIITAPFLAYGVSNTLAMCFPEAAGWIRISGLRFSPVFLVLATVMLVFAFFAFANAFTCNKKIQSSDVLKKDGFSNYLQHGVEILGIEGVKKLNKEMRQSFIIGLVIIGIEFSMNVSYFMQEIGGDLGGMLLSGLAALVPTAILIAETYMLSTTNFEIYACEELVAKIDRD